MDCTHEHTTYYEKNSVEVCDDCGDVVWEDL